MANSPNETWTNYASPRMNHHAFSFYIALPLALGVIFGLSQSGDAPMEGLTGHLIYWPLSMFISWQLLAIGSSIAALFLRPIGAPLVVILLVGNALGMAAWIPVSELRDLALSSFVQDGQTLSYTRLSDLPVSIANWALGATLWALANYVFLYVFAMPRFGYQPNSPAVTQFRKWLLSSSSNSTNADNDIRIETYKPRFYKRLNAEEPASILALVAEDHYTRAIMPNQEELVYIRFSDAMEEMHGQTGIQVHRSYWASSDAIADYSEKGHAASIQLSNGQTIPVSRSFRQIVKNALTKSESN